MKASGVTTGEEATTDEEWTTSGDTKTLSLSKGIKMVKQQFNAKFRL